MENYNNMQQNNLASQQGESEGMEISLRSIWKFFTGNWFWFLISVVICLGLGILYAKISPKVYSSSALIYVDENASRSVKSDVTSMTNLRMMRQTSVVDNEAAIIRSHTLMAKVVENLNLNVTYRKPAKLRNVEVYAPTTHAHVVADTLMRGFVMDLNLGKDKVSGIIKYTLPDGEKKEQKFTSDYDAPIYGEMGIVRVVKNDLYADDYAKAIEKIQPGGILFTFSCSQVVSKENFRTAVFTAAAMAKRNVRILHQLTQPADHPVSIYHPEGEYLKGLVLYVE